MRKVLYDRHITDEVTEAQRGYSNLLKVIARSLVVDLSLDFEFRQCSSRMDALNHSTRLLRLQLALPKQ